MTVQMLTFTLEHMHSYLVIWFNFTLLVWKEWNGY